MASPSGLWTSVSGGIAQSQNIDSIANNIANANTVGFKKDEPQFKEYLTAVENPPSPAIDIPHTPFKDSDFYHHDGRENAMVNLDNVHTDHTQGAFRMTNAPFDLAVDGPGFFAVQTPQGIAFTRAGDFKVNAKGLLVTTAGYPVLGKAPDAPESATPGLGQANSKSESRKNPFEMLAANIGRSPASEDSPLKAITVIGEVPGQKVLVSNEGQIFAGDQLLGTLAIAEFPDRQKLTKTASTLFINSDAGNIPTLAKQSRVKQGFIESSNVNTVSELVNLIKANRSFEGHMRAIRIYNDMAGKEANEVGKL